jgi:hypothetical protein
LESSHYNGRYTNLAALQTALPTAAAGDYTRVDAGAGADVGTYIWDDSDNKWVKEAGAGTTETAASVKTKYESNPDTNAFTDELLAKLNGLAQGVTNWLGLSDTPSSYAGMAGKFVKVKSTEDGLEFTDAPTGGTGASGTTAVLSGTVTYNDAYVGEYINNTGLIIDENAQNFGATTTNTFVATSGLIRIRGGSTMHIFTKDSSMINIYGVMYDENKVALKPANRSAALFETTLNDYTWTAPANAAYLNVYTRYNANVWTERMVVQTIVDFPSKTYNIPLTPEQFTEDDTRKINDALLLASISGKVNQVVCEGSYLLTSAILTPSNTTLVNNGLIKMASGMKDNMVRGASRVATLSNIKIKGVGTFEGSADTWGSGTPTDVGNQYWRAIGILLANVTELEIEDIRIKNSHMWGICLEQSRHGNIRNITFSQEGSKANQDGVNIRRVRII